MLSEKSLEQMRELAKTPPLGKPIEFFRLKRVSRPKRPGRSLPSEGLQPMIATAASPSGGEASFVAQRPVATTDHIPAVHGSCLCGAVRFRALLPTNWVAHCHCSCCRRAHGAPLVTWVGFASERFALDADSQPPAWYESSPGARRGFCLRCGSPMLFESTRWPGEMHVARSLIEGDLDKEPSVHVFYESHVPWLDVRDDLPKKVSASAAAGSAADPG